MYIYRVLVMTAALLDGSLMLLVYKLVIQQEKMFSFQHCAFTSVFLGKSLCTYTPS